MEPLILFSVYSRDWPGGEISKVVEGVHKPSALHRGGMRTHCVTAAATQPLL